ncbi:MaoC/PaaZ C-terminal domain-containing protein [Salininema proteolyticum]|uniref:MaoC/PaaZ C-terminal domain-containing protein n=1 Tax=Salininema proteolyticum TaxID=1607685 RepID=A0ABV8U0V0_9ACTN
MVEATAPSKAWMLWKGARDLARRYPDPMDAGLPGERLTLRDVTVNRSALRDYNAVCGFADSERLPFTYPHILGFKSQMAIMMDRAFPMPVTGMLHVSNECRQYKAIGLAEHFDLEVWAENLRPHHKGVVVDLRTEAHVAGEAVWSETSTYLRLMKRPGPRPPKENGEEDPVEGEVAEWFVPPRLGRDYAAVSGDYNPIHVSKAMSKAMGNKDVIAQGMWGLSRAAAELVPDGAADGMRVAVDFRRPIQLRQKIGFHSRDGDGPREFALVRLRDRKRYVRGTVSFDL